MIDKNLLFRAVEKWGDLQINLAIEECAEFIVEASHRKRNRPDNICEEIADVLIMMRQMQIIFGEKEVEKIIDEKMKRLEFRLDDGRDWTGAKK